MIIIWILLTLVSLLLIWHFTISNRLIWQKINVPYRTPCPIFGNMGATFISRRSYNQMLDFFYHYYRNENCVGLFFGRRPTLLVIDSKIGKAIMTTCFSCFVDKIAVNTDTKREPLLRNISNMSGAEWKALRPVVTSTFSPAKIKSMFPLIQECVMTLKNVMMDESLEDVDVRLLSKRYTTDVMGSCCFGVNPLSLTDLNSPFLKVSEIMFKTSRAMIIKRMCRSFSPRLFRLLNLRTYPAEVETFFTSIMKQVLDERRSTDTNRKDFVQLMLNVQSNKEFPLTDELITSNSFIFLLAGLETSSTTLSFCLFEMARKPELQAEIRQEIRECFKKYDGFTYMAVNEMHHLQHTVMETLRIHPPVPMTSRLCTSPCLLPGTNLKLIEKDSILMPIQCIQNDPALVEDPDKFNPRRFERENEPELLAFGIGPRCCPGGRFAILMISAAITGILSNFSIEPCSKTSSRIEYDPRSFILKNKGGIWLAFKKLPESDVILLDSK